MTKTHQHSGSEQLNLPLCPFNIGKYHKDDTNHWSEIIYIPSPVHIYCKKENPSDLCAITVTGRQCGKNKNCGRQLFKIMSDDVWLQGITINHAKDVVVNVDKGKHNSKLIDMEFVGNYVPEVNSNNRVSAGVVLTELDSSLEVLRSTFKWNQATAIYSRGSLVVYDSYFHGNIRSEVLGKGGAIFSTGEVILSKSSFLYNWGGEDHRAIWSTNDKALDAGGNCLKSKNGGCQGISTTDECKPFIGDDTICKES